VFIQFSKTANVHEIFDISHRPIKMSGKIYRGKSAANHTAETNDPHPQNDITTIPPLIT
jgi:hypothetical protein